MMSLSRASREPVETENLEGKGTETERELRPESEFEKKKKENLNLGKSQKFEAVTSLAGLMREEEPGANVGALPAHLDTLSFCLTIKPHCVCFCEQSTAAATAG